MDSLVFKSLSLSPVVSLEGWFWDPLRGFCPFVNLPTALTTDSLRAVPVITGKLVWPWVRCWQTIWHVTPKAAPAQESAVAPVWRVPRGLWLSRWWSETRQWYQPRHYTSFHPHLYSDDGESENTVMGTVINNVLWSPFGIALMSLALTV